MRRDVDVLVVRSAVRLQLPYEVEPRVEPGRGGKTSGEEGPGAKAEAKSWGADDDYDYYYY